MALGDNNDTGFPIYLVTQEVFPLYLISEPIVNKIKYFFTPQLNIKYILTEPFSYYTKYLFTPVFKAAYVFTPTLPENDIPNTGNYPKQLEIIRSKAALLYYKEISKVLKSSIHSENYGKVSMTGYNKTGMLRILLDYLSAVWIQRDQDSRSGIEREQDYYYTTYNINDIILNFRECHINIKPIVALFNLNSYTIIDDQWPDYFVIDKGVIPGVEKEIQMKQWTDIYTLQAVSPDRNQGVNSLSINQTIFIPSKIIKYFSAFTINGVDYTGYTNYNANSVTYSPSQQFGYNVENNDTVIITYWYEE